MNKHLALLALLLAACGPGATPEEAGVTIAQFRSGLTLGAAGGCSTSIAEGLTAQLVEELNCVTPNLMVNFSGSHTTLYSSVTPFLEAGASNDLRAATAAKGDSITISSAYRSLAAQALLYRWWQQGQCGIQLAAVPGTSNHQSGRAIDTPYHAYWKSALSAKGWTWLGSSDVVHFDHFGSPNIASKSVLAFQRLWNKNHSTGRLAEDGEWGPATSAALNQSPTTGFPIHGCPTTGKVSGTITQAGGGALSGVLVSAGGKSATTGAAGTFELTLPAGAVTVTASKPGFVTRSLTRTVQLGTTVSASMALSPVMTTGTLAGTVLAQGTPLAGANVSVAGRMLSTDSAGAFRVELPAGAVTITVAKAGYEVASKGATITAGTTTTVQVTLVAAMTDLPPVLTIDSPVPGASSPLANIVLSGSAVDDSGAVTLELVQGAQPAELVPVVGGRFEVPLRLVPGLNEVTLTAKDSAGHATVVRWTGTFQAGFGGLVHRFDDNAALVADAELTLFDPDTRELLADTRSDVDGRFQLDVASAGMKWLHVERSGYTPRDLLVEVSTDERTEVDVGLTPGELAGIRFIEPSTEGPFDTDTITVSGVVTGFEVSAVTVNGVPATLLGNGFLAKVPLPEGRTTLTAVAENPEGGVLEASVTAFRPMSAVKGGCASAPAGALVFLALALLRRRR